MQNLDKKSSGVSEIADRTTYDAVINDHLENKCPLMFVLQHKQGVFTCVASV